MGRDPAHKSRRVLPLIFLYSLDSQSRVTNGSEGKQTHWNKKQGERRGKKKKLPTLTRIS